MRMKTTVAGFCSALLLAVTALPTQAQISAPVIWNVGSNDNTQATGLFGGGPNTAFVQENGTINPLPGIPNSPRVNQQADNDYYFAGVYSNTIPSVVSFYSAYTPVGVVSTNEEAAER